MINEVRFFQDKSSATNRFNCFRVKETIFNNEIYEALKLIKLAKNVPNICIKLCAAGIFGCRICICSI